MGSIVRLPVPAQFMADPSEVEHPSLRTWAANVAQQVEWSARAVSAFQYGAKGDGVTDDTKALQALFTNEAYCLLPPGCNFLVSDTVFLTHPSFATAVKMVIAYGATVTFSGFARTCADNLSTAIWGICGAGTGSFSGWNGRWFGGTFTTAQKIVLFGGCGMRAQMQDVDFLLTGSGKGCVLLRNSINSHFDHCTFNATAVATDTIGSGTIWFADAGGDNVPNSFGVLLYAKLPQQFDTAGTAITYTGSMHFNDSLQFMSNLFAGGHVNLCDNGSDSHSNRVISGNEFAYNRYGLVMNAGALIDGNWYENTANACIYLVGGSPPWWLGTSVQPPVIRGNTFAAHNSGVGINVAFAPPGMFIHENAFLDCLGGNIVSTSGTGGTCYLLGNNAVTGSNSIAGSTVFQDLAAGGAGASVAVGQSLYGDASDGNVVISSGSITLTRDGYYNNLTINGTGKLITAGYCVRVAGILDISACPADGITASGTNGGTSVSITGGTAGVAVAGSGLPTPGSLNASVGASAIVGGTGQPSGAVTAINPGVGGRGGKGGNSLGAGGATAATPGAVTQFSNYPRFAAAYPLGANWAIQTGGAGLNNNNAGCANGGTGGASGRCASSSTGGGAGGGGGPGATLAIYARTINRSGSTAAGALSSRGGIGGNGCPGLTGTCAGGGGGGGGGGGWGWIVYDTLTGSVATNCVDCSGGLGGLGAAGLGDSGANAGDGGQAGLLQLFNLGAGTTTVINARAAGVAGGLGGAGVGGLGGTPGGAGGPCVASL